VELWYCGEALVAKMMPCGFGIDGRQLKHKVKRTRNRVNLAVDSVDGVDDRLSAE
jgi:hypothetical protein